MSISGDSCTHVITTGERERLKKEDDPEKLIQFRIKFKPKSV